MSKYNLPFVLDSLEAYVTQILAFYIAYRDREPFTDKWKSQYLYPDFPLTDESILFLSEDRALLEQQVVQALDDLSFIPLSYLPEDFLLEWGRKRIAFFSKDREEFPNLPPTFEQHHIDIGYIQKTGEGVFKYKEEKKAYRNYVDLIVEKVISSFEGHIYSHRVLGESFKAKTLGCFGTTEGGLLFYIGKEVFLQLLKEYSDGHRRFSVLDLQNLTAAEEYFLVYKAINTETVDMSIVNDNPELIKEQQTPGVAVILTQRGLIEKLLAEFQEQPQEKARFFELIVNDTTIPDDKKSFDFHRTESCINQLLDSCNDIWHEYLSDIYFNVITDNSVGSLTSKELAMYEFVRLHDARIVPILKALNEDTSSPLHKIARVELYGAIREMPEYFTESKYDGHKAAIKKTNQSIIRMK